MKRDRINSIFGGLLVAASLLTTACATNDLFEGVQADNGGKETITLTVTPQTVDMRGPSNYTISDGKKANILIYAIYKEEGGEWKIYTDDDVVEKDESTTIDGIDLGTGQKIIDWSESQTSELTLTIDKNTNYKLAFWAQSSSCEAYTTTDLEKVQVIYENAKNNDEDRDAFCASLEIEGKNVKKDGYTVTLKRPFAQINVGTTGADYKHLMTGSKVYPNRTITQSKIVLTGVSKYYNVLEGKTVDDEANTTATFGFNVIPAFLDTSLPIEEAKYYDGSADTQFLEVDLDKKDGIADYRDYYPTIKKTKIEGEEGEEEYLIEYLTETFKYLSMCYVLVPTTSDQSDNSTLSSVKVYFAEEKDKKDNGEVESDYMTVSLTQVPVRRNWRTNILGGLYEGDGSDDPEDPDDDPEDPTSIFNLISVTVSINPAFIDEYTTDYGSGVWIFPNTSTEEEPEEQPAPQE